MSVAGRTKSGKGAVGVDPLRYHFFVSIMVAGGAAKRTCVLPAVLDSCIGMSIKREKRLRRMEESWPDVQAVFPHESELPVAMGDGRHTLFTLRRCLLTASTLTPLTPMSL